MKFLAILSFLSLIIQDTANVTYKFIQADSKLVITELSPELFTSRAGIINEGIKNGGYWIYLPANTFTSPKTLVIASARIHEAVVYQNQKAVEALSGQRYLSFSIPKRDPVYIHVTCEKEGHVPLQVHDTFSFESHEKRQLFFIGLYYGIVVTVFIYNMLYFVTFRDISFLYYAMFLLSISMALFYTDGLFAFFEAPDFFLKHTEAIVHPIVVVMGFLFASNYLQMHFYLPKSKYVTYILMAILAFCMGLYFIDNNVMWFAFIDILALAILAYYWGMGIVVYRTTAFARFFVFAYALILLLATDFYFTKVIGITLVGVGTMALKAGGVVEMALLSYAVIYRMNLLAKENSHYRKELSTYLEQIKSLFEELDKLRANERNVFSEFDLSFRESEILQLIGKGKTNKEISQKLYISINTVKFHIKNIYHKIDVNSRQEARLAIGNS